MLFNGLTKQQQSARAAAVVKYLEKQMPHTSHDRIDALAVAKLINRRPTMPWEYPWAEVVRWCRDRRRT